MDTDVRLTTPTTRRTVVRTGAKLAYAAPLVATSLTLSVTNAAAISPTCLGRNVACASTADTCCDEGYVCGNDGVICGQPLACCGRTGAACTVECDCCGELLCFGGTCQ